MKVTSNPASQAQVPPGARHQPGREAEGAVRQGGAPPGVPHAGGQFNKIISACKTAPISARTRPIVTFEKNTCNNFQFWTFWAAFRAIFTTVVLFLIQ